MKKQTLFLLAATIILGVSFLNSTNATQRTFRFDGTITISYNADVPVGAPFVATLSYDDAQAPFSSGSDYAVYSNYTYEIVVSGMTFGKKSGDQLMVMNGVPHDKFYIVGTSPFADFNLIDNTLSVFSSTALPSTLTLSNFNSAWVIWNDNLNPNGFLGTINSITDITSTVCPQPQGDWKNNPDWPVAELMLGTQPYSQSELVDILNMPVGKGKNADASLILAKQLIAAKLNIANGVAASEEIQGSVDSADELIGSNTIPMSVGPRTASGKHMTNVAGFLESFNNGELTEGCSLAKSGATEDNKITQVLPDDYVLDQNYPNPFNPTTQIRFGIPKAGNVTLKIYNSVGQLVKTLVDGNISEGYYQVTWNATDNSGNKLSSGVYFYRITSGTFTQVNKMMLLK